jgi:hypothetical protein
MPFSAYNPERHSPFGEPHYVGRQSFLGIVPGGGGGGGEDEDSPPTVTAGPDVNGRFAGFDVDTASPQLLRAGALAILPWIPLL